MTKEPCWICKEQSDYNTDSTNLFYTCPRCGKYSVNLASVGIGKFRSEREIANVSGWIKENNDVQINPSVFQRLKNINTPSVNERAEKLLRWLDNQTEFLGQKIPINISDTHLWAICWVMNKKEVDYLIQHLVDRKFIIKFGDPGANQISVRVLSDGFSYLDTLNIKIQSNIGFCAMSFSPELLPAWDEAISPAITDAGYTPVRIDSEQYNTGIVDQIKIKIRQAKFVVADLTDHKHGVYYEAGLAHGLGREVIFTCREDEFKKRHFDVQHIITIKWKINEYADFKNMLQQRIDATFGRNKKL